VVEEGVESIRLDPRVMVHQRSIAAKLIDEDVVAQALRLPDLGVAGWQASGRNGCR
jgi:hypothetical protein